MYRHGFYKMFAQPSRCWVFRNQQVPDELSFHKRHLVWSFKKRNCRGFYPYMSAKSTPRIIQGGLENYTHSIHGIGIFYWNLPYKSTFHVYVRYTDGMGMHGLKFMFNLLNSSHGSFMANAAYEGEILDILVGYFSLVSWHVIWNGLFTFTYHNFEPHVGEYAINGSICVR